MEKSYDNIQDTLAFFGVDCNRPYYISTGHHLHHFPNQPFRIDYYSLCICSEGSIHVHIDKKSHQISKDGIMVAAPSTIINFIEASEDFRMKLLFFDKSFLLKNFTDPFILDRMPLFNQQSYQIIQGDNTSGEKWRALLTYLEKKTTETGPLKDEIIRTIIYYLLLQTSEIYLQQDQRAESEVNALKDIYFDFSKLVQSEAKNHKDVNFYAEKLCISNKYLIRIVKEACGKTPHEIIDDALLKEAYMLLSQPSLNISAVAYHLQFSSVATFSRFFKKHSGLSPAQYKKSGFPDR
ncbi:DNA-binding transcriptional regulator AraC [Sphingobacterium spiritivorum]|uniref:DNA-binding transcriptional regulator AraC n=1 Tax=Sphingobacterium spiritivorum TaxID=258 RepID=A0A380CSA4_SPHSI|nr:helix-turn-helix domain-containing protein [Sphingobacterium spiritivorum]SUJ25841.1 DNA-binding transcriptional regulator AraC [Sphingobacterium spiritivorum]